MKAPHELWRALARLSVSQDEFRTLLRGVRK